MGYVRVNQYANVTEIFEYEKNLPKRRSQQNYPKHWHLHKGTTGNNTNASLHSVLKERKKLQRLQSKAKRFYTRRKSSIKRSVDNFFRLVHHNNYQAKTINFVTLTFAYDCTYKEAGRALAKFFERIKKHFQESPISYIAVPELTKKNRFHFHVLIYNLPSQTSSIERETRNLQRQFRHGYVDIVSATFTSSGIAGYMAKYLSKSFEDARYETTRGYNCSRNIEPYRYAKGDTLSDSLDYLTPTENLVSIEEKSYDVPYLGECRLRRITTIKQKTI